MTVFLGTTQDLNESLDGIICTQGSKQVYVNRKTLEIGLHSDVLEFNEGKREIENVMNTSGLAIGNLQFMLNEKNRFMTF